MLLHAAAVRYKLNVKVSSVHDLSEAGMDIQVVFQVNGDFAGETPVVSATSTIAVYDTPTDVTLRCPLNESCSIVCILMELQPGEEGSAV